MTTGRGTKAGLTTALSRPNYRRIGLGLSVMMGVVILAGCQAVPLPLAHQGGRAPMLAQPSPFWAVGLMLEPINGDDIFGAKMAEQLAEANIAFARAFERFDLPASSQINAGKVTGYSHYLVLDAGHDGSGIFSLINTKGQVIGQTIRPLPADDQGWRDLALAVTQEVLNEPLPPARPDPFRMPSQTSLPKTTQAQTTPALTTQDAKPVAAKGTLAASQPHPIPRIGRYGTISINPIGPLPGDGSRAMDRAMRAQLEKTGFHVKPNGTQYVLKPQIKVHPDTEWDVLEVVWLIVEGNSEIGRIAQQGRVAKGILDQSWGLLAQDIAQGSAQGVVEALRTAGKIK